VTTKLYQVIAVSKSKKAESKAALTRAHHQFQKGDSFAGMERNYEPINDDDSVLYRICGKYVQIASEISTLIAEMYI